MDAKYRKLIADEFRNCVNGTIERVTHNEQTYRPFHTALLSEDVIFWSAFERSFSTSFGQRVIEELARLVALSNGAEDACRQKETYIQIDVAYEDAIHMHMQQLRAKNRLMTYAWNIALSQIKSARPTGSTTSIRVISDRKSTRLNSSHQVISIAQPNCNAYFGLPYNPFGERKQDYAFNPPMGIFDFHNDPVVLIGKEMWDTIGGEGCYEELLDIAREVGKETKDTIQRLRH